MFYSSDQFEKFLCFLFEQWIFTHFFLYWSCILNSNCNLEWSRDKNMNKVEILTYILAFLSEKYSLCENRTEKKNSQTRERIGKTWKLPAIFVRWRSWVNSLRQYLQRYSSRFRGVSKRQIAIHRHFQWVSYKRAISTNYTGKRKKNYSYHKVIQLK